MQNNNQVYCGTLRHSMTRWLKWNEWHDLNLEITVSGRNFTASNMTTDDVLIGIF